MVYTSLCKDVSKFSVDYCPWSLPFFHIECPPGSLENDHTTQHNLYYITSDLATFLPAALQRLILSANWAGLRFMDSTLSKTVMC